MTQLRGVDISDGMVELFNKAAESNGLTPDQMRAVQGDLVASPESDAQTALADKEFFNFDLIVMSMALHHIEHPEAQRRRHRRLG